MIADASIAASKTDNEARSSYIGISPIKIGKLGHLVYEVTDVERTAKFWTEVMGFHESDRNEIGMIFLRHDADHHAVALMPTRGKSSREKASALQVDHLAFEVADTIVLSQAKT